MTETNMLHSQKERVTKKQRLANDSGHIESLHALIREVANDSWIPDRNWVDQIILGVHEAFTNIIRHAYGGRTSMPIWVEATVDKSGLYVELTDDGVPFNPTAFPPLDWEETLTELPEGGYGIFLVSQIASSVNYHRDDNQNHLLLEFSLTQPTD